MTRSLALPPRPPTIQLLLLALVGRVHGGGQVPHLDAAVAVAREQVAAGSRPHAAGALTLPHHEGGDGGPVHRLHLADPDTHTHTHTRARTFTDTPTHAHTHSGIHAHAHTHTYAHTCIHTGMKDVQRELIGDLSHSED